MADNAGTTAATVIPIMRYNDAAAAVEWLCEAFGFEKHLVVPAEDGTIVHAQLVSGNGMVMLGSVRASEFDNLRSRRALWAPYLRARTSSSTTSTNTTHELSRRARRS